MFIVWPHVAMVVVWFVLNVVALRMLWVRSRLTTGIRWAWTLTVLMVPFLGALAAIAASLIWPRRAPVPPVG
ncbi:hypothetical protein [Curtobacterium sp. MCBD17_040]|uniref:hypothetical protein n=1 Tax=Curtobacterium sp. MCBD17_040 TaxID=2175674 RepID=UPI0024E0411F|nr:hypothetical protein [Curtobacterium sp. MCBD17_040]WIB65269.1 hypothetical protein DEI94_17845 [Curtobacterium sp. MCBD17_040]